jgi:peroxiredoxin Q/BCP
MAAKRKAKKKAAAPKRAAPKAAKKSVKKPVKKRAQAAAKKAVKKAVRKKVVQKKARAKPAPAAKTTRPASSLAGKAAPSFTLMNDAGEKMTLKDFRGRRVLLYFYPKDDTPGCTTQACSFRDAEADFAKADAVVLGVSKDSVKSHKKFKDKYKLNFPLLADDAGVCEAYGVWKEKSMYGRTYMGVERSTFLIDEDGKVRAEWRKVSVGGHAAEVTHALRSL